MAPTERLVAAGFTGKLVAGRYKLISMLGAGAVGEVWLAEHIHMRKRYALKIIDARIATPEIVHRFEREAVAAANITHPSVVAGTDFGRDEDGCFFLVLEYVAGVSLRKLVEAGPVPPKRALGIAKQILAAAGAAHAKGVVHRDLKPENVMLVERDDVDPRVATRDTVKVLDFGIAKVDPNSIGVKHPSMPPPAGENLTRAGTVWGTPTYMAPEQALGEPVDPRADIYAVGVIMYEMITQKPPFEGQPLEVIAYQIGHDAPPLSKKAPADAKLTPELEALVATFLKRSRDERPADVAEATALIEAAERTLVEAPKVVVAPQPSQRPSFIDRLKHRDRKAIAMVSGAFMILIAVPLILILAKSPSPVDEEETARPKKHADVASAAPSASASTAPSPSSSVATAPAKKSTTSTKSNEKGFGKLKSLFK